VLSLAKQILNEDIEEEVIIDKFYKVDLYCPAKKLIIEVNGPLHKNGKGNDNRKTQMKKKLLKKLGYKYTEIQCIDLWSKLEEQ
jgi:very-short-patch-repair endonuclease